MRKVAIALVLIGAVWGGAVGAQEIQTGFLDQSLVLEGTEYLYQVYVPRDYDDSRTWAVILSLHGAAARGSDGIRQTNSGIGPALRRYPDRYPAIAVFPQSPTDGPGWQELGGRVALAALDATMAQFRTDPSRVYLTGHSQGGNGSWYLSYHHPERFAAVAVSAGWIGEHLGTTSGAFYPAIVPTSSPDPFAAVAQQISHLPIWIFHGDADPIIPVEQSRGMASALKALGADVQYTEFPRVGHNAAPAYSLEDLPTWLFGQRRP